MKLKEGFVTRNMGGEQIMVATGDAKFSGFVRANPGAAFIVDCLKKETTQAQIVDAVLGHFDVSREVVEKDVARVLDRLREVGAIDE